MKLKQTVLFIAVFSIITNLLILPVVAQGSFTSSGTVSFKAKGVTPPVDPENPAEPQEPPEIPSTGQEGNLTLDVVPYPFFGEYPVPTINTVYKSKIVAGRGTEQGVAGAQTFIQVSDARPGSVGWNVSVKADTFKNSVDSNNRINGAKIIFSSGEVRGPLGPEKPVSYAITLNCIDDGEQQNEEKIFIAQVGNGIGTWVNCLYPTPWQSPQIGSDNDLIQLFIPANSGALEGATYYSNLIWTLSDAP